jgi:hypothetical protein
MNSPISAHAAQQLSPPENSSARWLADRTYKGVTIAAMLLLLASLCMFW